MGKSGQTQQVHTPSTGGICYESSFAWQNLWRVILQGLKVTLAGAELIRFRLAMMIGCIHSVVSGPN